MQEQRIRKTLRAEDSGTYLRLPFEVPDNTDRIDLRYAYPPGPAISGGEKNVVDIGLLDQDGRVRGWSGSDRSELWISERAATPGYRAGSLGKGPWAVVLGAYKISGVIDVDIVLTLSEKRRVLLAGDLHLHTVHSDGVYTPDEVAGHARRAGLDFIALTDHNNTEQNMVIHETEDLIVIPGMEYTNYRGHASFLFSGGRSRFDEDLFSSSFEEMVSVFRKARHAGALISLNHPACDACPWSFGFDGVPFDTLEVWNGMMKESEMKAISRWHALLAGGQRVAAVGGSDTHRHEPFRSYGMPTTWVFSESRTRSGVLAALSAGKSFLSYAAGGPQPDLRIGEQRLGETAESAAELEGEVRVERAIKGDLVRVLDRTGSLEWRVPSEGSFRERFNARSDAGFYRVEVWRELLPGFPMLCALTNPVYVA